MSLAPSFAAFSSLMGGPSPWSVFNIKQETQKIHRAIMGGVVIVTAKVSPQYAGTNATIVAMTPSTVTLSVHTNGARLPLVRVANLMEAQSFPFRRATVQAMLTQFTATAAVDYLMLCLTSMHADDVDLPSEADIAEPSIGVLNNLLAILQARMMWNWSCRTNPWNRPSMTAPVNPRPIDAFVTKRKRE